MSYIWNARCSPLNLTRCCLERRWIFSCPAASFQWTFECSQKSLDSCHQDMSLRSLFHICITFEIWHSHLICVPFEHEKSLCCVRVLEKSGSEKFHGVPRTSGWLKCRARPVRPRSEYCIQFDPTTPSSSTFILIEKCTVYGRDMVYRHSAVLMTWAKRALCHLKAICRIAGLRI